MLIAALVTIAGKWKQPKCPSVDRQIMKCGPYAMEYYSAVAKKKKNEIMNFVGKWKELVRKYTE